MLYKIDGFVLKFIPNRKYRYGFYCSVAILIICLIWISLTYLDFWDGIWHIVKSREVDYIFGLAISIVSLFFGIWILDIIKGGTANNIDEFLNLLNYFFEDINNNNDIIIVTPTLFIGGVNPNHLSERYQDNIVNLLNHNTKVEIYTEDDISNFITAFDVIDDNEDVIDKKSFLINNTCETNKLIKFHKDLFITRSSVSKRKDPTEKVNYFHRLTEFYKKIKIFNPKSYIRTAEELQIILFLNESISKGVFGIFSDNYNISGHIVKGKNITQALKTLVLNNHNKI